MAYGSQGDLTTPQRVKGYLRMELSPDAQNTIADLIATASKLARIYTRRAFSSPPETFTRSFPTNGSPRVYIDEVRSLADIVSVADGAGVELPYEAVPDRQDSRPGSRDMLKGVRLHLGGGGASGARTRQARGGLTGLIPAASGLLAPDHSDLFTRNVGYGSSGSGEGLWALGVPNYVEATALFGYEEDEIPAEVEFAVRRAVALWFKEEVAHYTEDAFISRGRQFNPEMLPPISTSMLAPWRIEEPVF